MESEYNEIKITGPITVQQREEMLGRDFWSILVMGPTGSGKSTFIEALADPAHPLVKISSNQLEGFTQTVSPYELTGLTRKKGSGPIFFVDTPGFADAKISELDIVLMIQKYMETEGIRYFNRVLYMVPITSVRMPGSQRQVLNTFKALTAVIRTADQITLVTTMWDALYTEQALQRAEATYAQLQDDIWKECISRGSRLARFNNDRESTLRILDDLLGDSESFREFFPLEARARGDTKPLRDCPFGINLYKDLTNRVQSLRLRESTLEIELADPLMELEDPAHKSIFDAQLQEAKQDLDRLEKQLEEFGRPSNLPPDEELSVSAAKKLPPPPVKEQLEEFGRPSNLPPDEEWPISAAERLPPPPVKIASSPRSLKSALSSVKRWGKKRLSLNR